MTPLVRVAYSPFVQLATAAALVTLLAFALFRPPAAVVVVVQPAATAAAPSLVNVVAPYPYCYGWNAWPSPCWRD